LIPAEVLNGSSDPHDDFCGRHGLNVSAHDGTVSKFEGVVGRCSEFVTYTASRSIIWSDLQWKVPGSEAFLAECQHVLPRCDLNDLWRSSCHNAVHFNFGTLWDGVNGDGDFLDREKCLKLLGQRTGYKVD